MYDYRITVNERTEKGTSLLKLGNTAISKHVANPHYTIIDGNSDNTFQMLRYIFLIFTIKKVRLPY